MRDATRRGRRREFDRQRRDLRRRFVWRFASCWFRDRDVVEAYRTGYLVDKRERAARCGPFGDWSPQIRRHQYEQHDRVNDDRDRSDDRSARHGANLRCKVGHQTDYEVPVAIYGPTVAVLKFMPPVSNMIVI